MFFRVIVPHLGRQTNVNGSFEYPDYAGQDVYVFDINTGLTPEWPTIFPSQRIGEKYAGCIYSNFNQTVDIDGVRNNNPGYPRCWQYDSGALQEGIGTHGTACAACVLGFQALRSNGEVFRVMGSGPRATYVPIRIQNVYTQLDDFEGGHFVVSSDLARGLLYAADLKAGELADSPCVINLSFGSVGGADAPSSFSPVVNAAVEYALSVGCVIVVAAGDANTSICFPASHPGVISVGFIGSAGAFVPPYSGTFYHFEPVDHPVNGSGVYVDSQSPRPSAGQQLTLVAPGSYVVLPNVPGPGDPALAFWWGSSFSSPYVAGVVASMLSKNNTLTPPQVKQILMDTAVPLGAGCSQGLDFDFVSDVYCWPAEATGAGLVNAAAAVDAA